MDTILQLIPAEYWFCRMDHIEKTLAGIPVIRTGYRFDKPVYRIYETDRKHYRQISQQSNYYSKAKDIAQKRIKLETLMKSIQIILRNNYRHCKFGKYSVVHLKNRYNAAFFDSLKDSSCTYEKNNDLCYNGRQFRSRSEMLIATVLDEFGIEFKYDVAFECNGQTITIDFVLVFREFNRCLFLEYYGRSDKDYNIKRNADKFMIESSAGMYLGRDVHVLSGDESFSPGADVIRIRIISMIAELAAYHIKVEKDEMMKS